jgi:hypothetical protein
LPEAIPENLSNSDPETIEVCSIIDIKGANLIHVLANLPSTIQKMREKE